MRLPESPLMPQLQGLKASSILGHLSNSSSLGFLLTGQRERCVRIQVVPKKQVSLSAGGLLLLLGSAALATGYLLPPKLEGIGEAEFVVLDQQAVEYNHALGTCRAVGTVLCAMAGALLVTCVLSSGLARMTRAEEGHKEEGWQESPPGKWGAAVTEPPVPFRTSWVQPKREM
ncbi:neurensin-2 isoform X2 [Anolis carolinensis]|uniref:neurensin-2 isoform X2 n=1 Tax=Anolis carolinensis TaxID=28377 RepID=UPI002F2B6F29